MKGSNLSTYSLSIFPAKNLSSAATVCCRLIFVSSLWRRIRGRVRRLSYSAQKSRYQSGFDSCATRILHRPCVSSSGRGTKTTSRHWLSSSYRSDSAASRMFPFSNIHPTTEPRRPSRLVSSAPSIIPSLRLMSSANLATYFAESSVCRRTAETH